MAVSVPVLWNGMYLGGLSEGRASQILQIRKLTELKALEHSIFNFPYDLVLRAVENNTSVREIIKEEGIDYEQYRGSLRTYQQVGSAFMYLSPRSILGDGVGLGKTAEISSLINVLKQRGELTRFLIAVENSAISQTLYELIKFTGLNIVALPSEAVKLRKIINKLDWRVIDGVIIKHSCLRSDVFSKFLAMNLDEQGMSRLFNTFFLDESSIIKNDTTKTYTYTRNICNIVSRVHFMNATTFETSIIDIYTQADMMNPALLPKRWRIDKEYSVYKSSIYWTKENGVAVKKFKRDRSGYKNQEKFKQSLGLVYFGRCKADIGMELPHIYKVYEVFPTIDQMAAINQGHRYMEVLNCPSLVDDINIPTDKDHVPKLERLVSLVENEFKGSKVMIYAFHNEAQERIAEEMRAIGRNPLILNGSTPAEDRYEIQEKFNHGDCDVVITNIKKSLNLYGGDVCIFYSVLTVPSAMEQAAGRVDRNVNDNIKTFVLLLYKGTDEYNFFVNTVKQRAKDSRDLTIDTEMTVDKFIQAMKDDEYAEAQGG